MPIKENLQHHMHRVGTDETENSGEVTMPKPTPAVARFMYWDAVLTGAPVDEKAIQKVKIRTEKSEPFNVVKGFVQKKKDEEAFERQTKEGRETRYDILLDAHAEITNWINREKKKSPPNQDVIDVLEAVGIDRNRLDLKKEKVKRDIDYTENGVSKRQPTGIRTGLASFHDEYLNQADFVKLLTRIADSCREKPDNAVNVGLLEKRLHAAGTLLKVFVPDSVAALVRDVCLTYGYYSQKDPSVKETIAKDAAEAFNRPITDQVEASAFEELKKGQNTEEKRDARLTKAIKDAEQEALREKFTTARADKMRKDENGIIKTFLTDPQKTGEEYLRESDGVKDAQIAVVEVATIEDFRRALELLKIAGNIDHYVKHERAHFIEAQKQGCDKIRFEIQLAVKPDNKTFAYYPYTTYRFPQKTTDQERRDKMRLIIDAPKKRGVDFGLGENDDAQLAA